MSVLSNQHNPASPVPFSSSGHHSSAAGSSSGGEYLPTLQHPQQSANRFGQLSRNAFFGRHNPHPCRVRHMKGLLDCPVCIVDDNADDPTTAMPRMPVYAVNLGNLHAKIDPDTVSALQHFTGLRNYSFKEKADPQLGLAPITDNWRLQLRAITDAAVNALKVRREAAQQSSISPELQHPATWMLGNDGAAAGQRPASRMYSQQSGRLLPSGGGRPRSQASGRLALVTPRQRPVTSRDVLETRAKPLRPTTSAGDPHQHPSHHHPPGFSLGAYEHIFHEYDPEVDVFNMLCGILQTDDTNAVRAWLSTASEREKCLVLDIIQAAMQNRHDYYHVEQRESLNTINEEEDKAHDNNFDRLVVHDSSAGDAVMESTTSAEDSTTESKQRLLPNRPVATSTFRPTSPQKQPGTATGGGGVHRRLKSSSSGVKEKASVPGGNKIPQPQVWDPMSSVVT